MKKLIGLIIGFCALLGAGYFYWVSLVSETVAVRVSIPTSELRGGNGVAYWSVPESWRKERWHRTPARVFESGKPLSFRVERAESVGKTGDGRFCCDGTSLYFSSTDGSDPLKNGRVYEAEIHRLTQRWNALAGFCLVVAGSIFIFNSVQASRVRALGICFSVAVVVALGMWLFVGATISIPVNSGAVMRAGDGEFYFYLPRWIRNSASRVDSCVLFEDQKAFRRADATEASAGSFLMGKEELRFRTGTTEGHNYRMEVLLLEPHWRGWEYFAVLSLGFGLVAYQLRKRNPESFDRVCERFGWWVPVMVICAAKFWVIAGDEVVAQQADALGYAQRASVLVWGSSVFSGHPVGFSLVTGLVAQFGVPWRLALEIFFMGMCFCLSRVVVQLAESRLAGLLLFAGMVWHPWTFSGFRDFMPDPITMVVLGTLLATGCSLLMKGAREWSWGAIVVLGLLLFVWESIRDEEPLLLASYGVFVVLAIVQARPDFGRLGRFAGMLALPLVMMFGLETASKTMMYHRYGVYAKSGVNLPGLKALLKALYRVRPEQTLRYAPVTHQSLEAAIDTSPSLQPFKKDLLDTNAAATRYGMYSTKIPGEFGPYLYWLLLANVAENPPTANKTMLKAAAEIQTALDEGKLPKRHAWWPLDPNWRLWLPDLPRCFGIWFGKGTDMSPAGDPWGTIYHNPVFQHAFDVAANRRAANTYPLLFLGQGAVRGPAGIIDSVAIADSQGRWRTASVVYPSNYWGNGQSFELRFPMDEPEQNFRLLFLHQGAVQFSAPVTLMPHEYPYGGFQLFNSTNALNLSLAGEDGTFSYDFQAGVTGSEPRTRRATCEEWLGRNYKRLLVLALGFVFFIVLRLPVGQVKAATLCLIMATCWFTLRAAFYGVLVATMEFGQPRYMRCVSPLFILVLFLGVVCAALVIKRIFLKQRTRRMLTADAGRLRS
jgi:hypothetical protein